MITDPLLSDELDQLLSAFPNDALRAIVGILKRHSSWSPFPQNRSDAVQHLPDDADFTPHAHEIAREVVWWGSHEVGRQFGFRPKWRDIVSDVAKQLGVKKEDRATTIPVWKIEQATLKQALAGWEKLSPKEREEALRRAGDNINAARGGLAAALGGIIPLGGEGLIAFLAARGASYALAATVFAPVATTLGAAWAAHDLAGPAFRVLRPAVLTIGFTRQRLRDERAASAFED